MDKVDSNDNNTLDDWDMHHPAKKIKVNITLYLYNRINPYPAGTKNGQLLPPV